MMQPGRRASFAICLTAAIIWASAASARTERLRWTESSTAVDNFKLYWGLTSGSPSSSLSVGVPAKDSTGAYYYDLVVADAGTFYFTVTAWAGGLESAKSNEIARAGISTAPPPSPTPSPTSCPAGQFLGEYFANQTLSGTPVLSRCEAAPLNYQWGQGSPGSGVPAEGFSARWVGTFAFDAATYRFTATADDGVRVIVDGQTVIDKWINQSPTTYTGDLALTAASHQVRIEYFEGSGGAVLQASWAAAPGTIPPPSSTTLGAPGQPYIIP